MTEWSIKDKVCIVTGANSGLGRETALELVKMGAGRVILTCRNMESGKEAVEYIKKETAMDEDGAKEKLGLYHLDLSSLASVRKFAKEILENEKQLDCLIENAGVLPLKKKTLTKDGLELAFGTNHVGHFLLVQLLLDLMKKSEQARIVVVASKYYFQTAPDGFHIDDVNYEKTNYTYLDAYAQSKLANILFARELDRRLKADSNGNSSTISVFSLHPGIIHTNMGRNLPGYMKWMFKTLMRMRLIRGGCSVEDGIKTTINCATKPGIEKFSGQYFSFEKSVNLQKKNFKI